MIRPTSVPSPAQSREYYVDAAEAARFLSVHPRTLQQLARAGIVPAHPLGSGPRKFWRFLLSELDDWLRARIDSSRGAVRVIGKVRFNDTVSEWQFEASHAQARRKLDAPLPQTSCS
jgi:hypothetical protein